MWADLSSKNSWYNQLRRLAWRAAPDIAMRGDVQVARFNLSHTVADIQRFIIASRPDVHSPVRLATAFPAAALNDGSVTIEAAGLQNATIVQKPG